MEEPNSPEDASSPAQPAEEIPDWVKGHQLDENLAAGDVPPSPEAGTDQPVVETLAEKHKARRQTFHRLVSQAEAVPDEASAAEGSLAELENPAPTEPRLVTPVQEESLLDAARLKLHGFGQKARGFAQGIGQRVRMLAQRITRREPPVQEAPIAQEAQITQKEPASRRMQNVWPRLRPFLWRGRIGPAFWTVASTLSLAVNLILIVILILLGRQLFFLKKTVVSDQLINGLYDNFVLMDEAHIKTTIHVSDTIQVKDTIPVVFDLPLSQKTVVTLTESTPIKGATIYLNGQPVPLDLDLPPGTKLGIALNLTVPVNQTVPVVLNVPVNLTVPVDIPLDRTELHEPFVGLQQVLSPFRKLLGDVPDQWSEVCKGVMKVPCSVLRFK